MVQLFLLSFSAVADDGFEQSNLCNEITCAQDVMLTHSGGHMIARVTAIAGGYYQLNGVNWYPASLVTKVDCSSCR